MPTEQLPRQFIEPTAAQRAAWDNPDPLLRAIESGAVRSRRDIIAARIADIEAGLLAVKIEDAFGLTDLPDIEPETTISEPVKLPRELTATLSAARKMRKP
jgi:hypothetical protein